MLDLENINKEIEKREKSDRLTNSVCQELSWLYTVRDHLEGKCNQASDTSYPRSRTQALNLDMQPADRKQIQLTRSMAEQWASKMQNADGTTGPHWTMEQTNKVMAQKQIGGSPWAFWLALNATYSDMCKVFQKYGINNMDAYVDFAKAFWLEDRDAVGGGGSEKLAAYYDSVVRH